MNSKDFIKGLALLMPDKEHLQSAGYGEKEIERIAARFNIEPTRVYKAEDDPIIDLLLNYQVDKLEIGMIHFQEELLENENYFLFGNFAGDALCIDKSNKNIVLIDEQTGDQLLFCASNSSTFLNAILFASNFLSEKIIKLDFGDDQAASCHYACQASTIAGGSEYLDFYKQLVGCFE